MRGDLELFGYLLSFLKAQDIAHLAQTGVSIRDTTRTYHERTFDVDRYLTRSFARPIEFREMQQHTGALVSGSTALQLFERTTYHGSDLDVYVERRYSPAAVRFVRDREQYLLKTTKHCVNVLEEPLSDMVNRVSYDDYVAKGISEVLTFVNDDRHVQVIIAERSPMEIILNFHSSTLAGPDQIHTLNSQPACVMNLFTHHTAYSLFPRHTFVKKTSRILNAQRSARARLADNPRRIRTPWIHLRICIHRARSGRPLASYTMGRRSRIVEPNPFARSDQATSGHAREKHIQPRMGRGERVFVKLRTHGRSLAALRVHRCSAGAGCSLNPGSPQR